MNRFILVLGLMSGLAASSNAGDWPAWRGPTGQGVSDEQRLPLTWSETENVKWKIPLENPGNSTPIIWGNRIFLTQAKKGGSERSLFCYDRATGKQLWKKDVEYAEKERNWTPDWYANLSPVTDGQRVVVSFGSAGMHCYDFEGKELWKRTDLGQWDHAFGHGSSPVLYKDLAILLCGPTLKQNRNFLLAVDKTTGKTVWEHDEKVGAWSTPLIVNVNGQDQLLLAMSSDVKGAPDDKTGHFKGFDPNTGKELWYTRGVNSHMYASPLYAKGIAVAMSGYQGAALAVKLGGTDNITKDRLWIHPKNVQRVGSGVIVGDHVYIMDENGMPRCYELESGKETWNVQERPGSGVSWGSMAAADGKLYVMMRDGSTLVFNASPKYELLATNRLGAGEQTNSSPAISNGEIFLRTFRHLWCIAPKK